MLLTGTYSRAIDEKLRVAIPKRLRDLLGGPALKWLYVAPGTDGALALYSEEAFSRLAARLAEASPTGKEVRAFSRLFFAQAQRLEIDQQGRVRIPSELARLIGLEREAMLLGVQDHLELWEPTRWQSYFAQQQAHYDEIAERAFVPPGSEPGS
jgi:MraZ protein